MIEIARYINGKWEVIRKHEYGEIELKAKCPMCNKEHNLRCKVIDDVLRIPLGNYLCNYCDKQYYLISKRKEDVSENDIVYCKVGNDYIIYDEKKELI